MAGQVLHPNGDTNINPAQLQETFHTQFPNTELKLVSTTLQKTGL